MKSCKSQSQLTRHFRQACRNRSDNWEFVAITKPQAEGTLKRAIQTVACTAVLFAVFAQSAFCDVVIYESATGNLNDGDGFAVSNVQFMGSRFTLSSPTQVTSVGGTFISGATFSGSVFASLVDLGGNNLPQGNPFDNTDVLISAIFTPTVAGDDFVPLSIALPAGDYAVVFGAGLFGSESESFQSMSGGTTTTEGSGSYIFWNAEAGQWNEADAEIGRRFVVNGVPEPSSTLALFGLGSVLITRRRRK
jgi:hypothetical protein